ncbi:hypothetical protein [Haloarcula onubensis]|uniref:Phage tail tape measure protein n=1 Tax=Haloarcula onubensis TaxID=2950539 RepID=A0ABU2FWR4_9EURY|nr:hypothetical protein [Halomicroarcula sp. S3CR25-11]MDS0284677.1 hypothetical protein [Halomicroarcula sp. S3CR25-11]
MFEALNVSLLASDTISSSLRGIAGAADSAGAAAAASSVEFGAFGEALDAVDDDAMELAVGAHTAKGAVDELGDESLESAAELQTLSGSMGAASASSAGLAASLGPLRGSISSLGPIAAGVVPPLIGLGGALGGLATAGGGAAAGIAAIAGAGLQRKAENMAAASSEFADSGEAMQAIMDELKASMSEAIAPLKTMASTEFAMAGLEGLVELTGIAATSIAELQDTLMPLGSALGADVLEAAPVIFDEIGMTVEALSGQLEGLGGVIQDIPEMIAWFREQAVALTPELGNFAGSLIGATAAIGSFGTSILELILPPLSVALDLIGYFAGLLAAIPKPLLAAAGAFAIYTAAVAVYGGVAGVAAAASTVLAGTIGALTAPISGTALAIAAVIGAVVGIITYFGWWEDIINVVTAAWNGFVEIVEFGIEITYAMIKAIGDILGPIALVLGPLGVLIWTIDNLGRIIDWAGQMFRWFSGLVNDVVSNVLGWVDTAVSAIRDLMDWAMNVVNAIPGVNIDFGNIQENIELDALKSGGGDEGGEQEEKTESEQTKNEAKNHYDFRGADFGGASATDVERTVSEAIRKANRDSRAREDAQGF